jgi:hypothetical protein
MKTANIWLCVLVHGLYNFCGAVIPRLGEGVVWDTFTVVVTVIISLVVAAYMVIVFVKDNSETIKNIYKKPTAVG